MSEKVLNGGCQCGAVRFRATNPGTSEICHCRMCQKAFGNYFAALVAVERVEWTRGAPGWFRSSNVSQRGFCAQCGTPLGIMDDDGDVELATGAFDDPEAVPPTVQFNLAGKLSYFDHLPQLTPQPQPEKEAEVNAKITSYQHPDHETADWTQRA